MGKLIFSDVDNTLVYPSETLGEDTVTTRNELGGALVVSARVLDVISYLRKKEHLFILVTGRRWKSYLDIKEIVPHDYAILENGGMILNHGAGYGPDAEWQKQHRECIEDVYGRVGRLWNCKNLLLREGYDVEDSGRYYSFRVKAFEGSEIRPGERINMKGVIDRLVVRHPVRVVVSESGIEVMPATSGKRNAAQYVVDKLGRSPDDTAALGDGYNDLDLLEYAAQIACPSDAVMPVQECVRKRGGYVSAYGGVDGAIDTLSYLGGIQDNVDFIGLKSREC